MVKQTQWTLMIAAAVLLLLLSFGLGFYTYPLVNTLNSGQADVKTGQMDQVEAADEIDVVEEDVVEEVENDSASLTASNQSDLSSSDSDKLADAQPATGAQSITTQSDEGSVDTTSMDLSGIEAADLEIFLEAWRALERDFFGERPESRQQIYGAIRGLLESHDDPYTFFIEPETNEVEQGNLRGSFGGIGAHVQPTEFGFVLDPIRDNPAQKAGIMTGDLLVRVDEFEVNRDTPIDDVVAMIRGPLDTEVSLGLLRPVDHEEVSEESLEDAEPLTITVTRAEIRTPSVDWRVITGDEIPVDLFLKRFSAEGDSEGAAHEADAPTDEESKGEASSSQSSDDEDLEDEEPDDKALPLGITEQDIEAWTQIRIGYIQHRIYSDRSPEEMRTAIQELQAEGVDRYIIDLRGNPGGPVTSVVQVADIWIDEALIMSEERADGNPREFEASEETLVNDEPIIIVVDGGTASASEIFAGALRDHDRALILGEKTFGKGSVQVIHVLPDSSSMHITNARWFTPDGHKIDGTGLLPDIEIEPGADALQEAILQMLDVVNE